jgi:DNA repair exonuclease SbcCD ATPase subunit
MATTQSRNDVIDRLLTKIVDKQAAMRRTEPSIPFPHHQPSSPRTSPTGPQCCYPPSSPGPCKRSAPRITRLVQQLATASSQPDGAGASSVAAAAAAIEATVYQFETDAIAAQAARRRAEQEASASKAQLAALTRSHAQQRADWEDALQFARSQAATRTESATRVERDKQRLSAELSRLQAEAERHKDVVASYESRLRDAERTAAAATTHAEALSERVQAAESEARGAAEARAEADTLRRELCLAKDQMEEMLRQQMRGVSGATEAIAAARDAVAQRAALMQECRGLRSDVTRLQTAMLEEQAEKERLVQEHERASTAAQHEVESLKSKLDSRIEAVRLAEAAASSLRTEVERTTEAHQTALNALRERLAQEKRALAEAKRHADETMAAAECTWEERTAAAVEAAVARHRQRIQDLELQLAHFSPRDAGARSAATRGPIPSSFTIPGGFVASILDYIPRSEHIRLLEAREAARAAETQAQVAAAKAQADAVWRAKVDVINAELAEAREGLERVSIHAIEQESAVRRAEHGVSMLQGKNAELESALLQSRGDITNLTQLRAEADAQLQKLQSAMQDAATAAEEAAQTASRRIESAHAALSEATQQRQSAERAEAAAARRCADLEASVGQVQRRNETLTSCVDRLKADLQQAERKYDEEMRARDSVAQQLHEATTRCASLQTELAAAQRAAETAAAKAEEAILGATAAHEQKLQATKEEVLKTVQRVEHALGISPENGTSAEGRLAVIESRCRELHAERQRANVAAQRALDDVATLHTSLESAMAQKATLEGQLEELNRQYQSDLEQLERVAGQERGDLAAAAAASRRASGLGMRDRCAASRKPSLCGMPYESIGVSNDHSVGIPGRVSTLGQEIQALKGRLAAQAQHAQGVEGRERELQSLLQQLTSSLGVEGKEKLG